MHLFAGFKLSNPMGLKFKCKSFDDNNYGAGSFQVCSAKKQHRKQAHREIRTHTVIGRFDRRKGPRGEVFPKPAFTKFVDAKSGPPTYIHTYACVHSYERHTYVFNAYMHGLCV